MQETCPYHMPPPPHELGRNQARGDIHIPLHLVLQNLSGPGRQLIRPAICINFKVTLSALSNLHPHPLPPYPSIFLKQKITDTLVETPQLNTSDLNNIFQTP